VNTRSQVLLASAGSGKTFRLTSHFLRLVAQGARPERVVASTFTRKAAGEILGRLFARLAGAASSADGAALLSRELDVRLERADALALLGRLAREIQRFRVRTLDAFFVELARASAAELGLPPDWRIADEVELGLARDAALGAALADADRGAWTVLLSELERGRSSRGVHQLLRRVVDESHRLHLEARLGAWEAPALLRGPSDADFERALEQVRTFAPPLTKAGKPDSRWQKALLQTHEMAAAREFEELLERSLVKAWFEKGEYFNQEFPEELLAHLGVLVERAAAQLGGQLRAQNGAASRLLSEYERRLADVRLATRRLSFDDLTRCLGRDEGVSAHELALRVDGEIDHLLLDEFQDTSPAQWRVLRGLASELAADGTGERSLFCVGDVKQSIYGWRAAEPRLLENLPHEFHLEPESLDVSWRSSPVVLEAVNQVFGNLTSFPGFAAEHGDDQTAAEFSRAFHPHVAQRADLPGCVRVWTAAARNGREAPWAQCLDAAVERVRALRDEAPWASIAVLVRRNALAATLVAKLRDAGIAASDEGGNPLTDAVSVQAALATLHWLEHPADTVARFHVATSVLARRLGLVDANQAAYAAAHARAQRARLDLGLAEWLAQWRDDVERELGAWEARRFARLIDAALGAPEHGSLSDFAERVRRLRVEDPSAALVKVMTIHASKGLEFDAVVLPELDGPLVGRGSAFVARRVDDDPLQPFELLSHAGSSKLRTALAVAGDPSLVHAERATRRRAFRDSLSALYVALTRARRRLDLVLWAEGPKDGEARGSAAALVRHAFGLGFENLTPATLVAEVDGSVDEWARRAKTSEVSAVALPTEAAPRLEFALARRPRELERFSPSRLGAGAAASGAELFESTDGNSRRRGTRWHAWFEQIEWLDAFEFDAEQLLELARARGLGGAELERDLEEFQRALAAPALRELFTRPAGEVEVWRERAYRCVIDEALHSGAFDRVVLERSGGAYVRARILDFKSDRGRGDENGAAERYRPQLEAYARALVKLCGLPRDAIRTTLVFAAHGALVEV
jgi:ATP-dependent exoDNAse (exonuclease V) beta subunit